MITAVCPTCKAEFHVEDSYAGYNGECPYCNSVFPIPSPTGTSGTQTEPPQNVPVPEEQFEITCPECGASIAVSGSAHDIVCDFCDALIPSGVVSERKIILEEQKEAERKRIEEQRRLAEKAAAAKKRRMADKRNNPLKKKPVPAPTSPIGFKPVRRGKAGKGSPPEPKPPVITVDVPETGEKKASQSGCGGSIVVFVVIYIIIKLLTSN